MADRPGRPGAPRRRTPATPVRAVRSRPAGRRGGAGSGAATRTVAPRARGRFTGRAVVLAVVLLALALSYVFPLRVYLAQQAEIAELRAAQDAQRAHIDRLAAEAALWRDEDYIRIQARKRLYFGEPGEILLIPQWPADATPPVAEPDRSPPPAPPTPWWDTLWTSVESADRPDAGG